MAAQRRSALADSFQLPSRLAGEHDPSVLRAAFVLSRAVQPLLDGWARDTLDGWTLTSESTLPVLPLEDSEGRRLGWVVGHPIDLSSRSVLDSVVRLASPADGPDLETGIDEELHRFGGRWVGVVLRPRPLAYPDGSGSLPVFYSQRQETLASSPFLLTDGSRLPEDSRLAGLLRVYETGLTFGLGSTAVEGVELLPPNHVLDLGSWEPRRCWPRVELERLDLDAVVEGVASSFETTVAAAVSIGPAHVGLTAGGDTRMIAACSRELVDRIDFFTVPFRDESGSTDARWAPRVASRYGLRHRILPWIRPTQDDVRLWMYRSGCITGERRGRLAAPTYAQLGGAGVYVSGVGGNAARADYMRVPGGYSENPSSTDLLRFIGLPADPELERRLRAWQEQLPPLDVPSTLTLLQFEMCDSGWGGALASSYPDAAEVTFYPYCSRDVMECLVRTDWNDRRADRVRRGVIESRWPELLDPPLNRMALPSAARRKGRRYVAYARAAVRKSRRL